jgi:hypothetical protein
MKRTSAATIALLAVTISGCGWIAALFSPEQKGVPVTNPEEVNGDLPAATTEPSEPAPASVSPQPGEETRPTPETLPAADQAGQEPEPTQLTELLQPVEPATQPATQPATRRATPPSRPAQRPLDGGETEIVAAGILQVNRAFISAEEIVRDAGPRLAALPPGITAETFLLQAARIIDEEARRRVHVALVLAEARNRLDDQKREFIDAQVRDIERAMIAGVGGSRRKLAQQFAQAGTTIESELARHRRELTVRAYLQERFAPAIVVTPKMLWDYYRLHKAEFSTPKKVQMQIIAAPLAKFLPGGLANPSQAERDAARQRAREVVLAAKRALDAGKDFGEVAKELSRGVKAAEGGVWPLMEKGSFREVKVEEAAFALAPAEVSQPIETETGFYIVKARRVVQGQVVGFRDAQERIEQKLMDQKHAELVDRYYDRLYAEAIVRRSNDFMRVAVQRAVEKHRKP